MNMRPSQVRRFRLLAPLTLMASLLGPGVPALQAGDCASGGTSALPPVEADFLRSYRASLNSPTRLAVDSLGRVYVADPAQGRVLVRASDGRIAGIAENLGYPVSIAVDATGQRIFVGDGVEGRVTAYTADWQRSFDLGQGAGEVAFPGDIAVDPETGRLWITDSFEHRVRVYGPTGDRLFSFGSEGTDPGQFQFPMGIFVDAEADEVLVVDQINGRVQIFDRAGAFKLCIGVKGSGAGRFNLPQGIWVDSQSRIYVADAFEGWIQVVDRQGAAVAFFGSAGEAPGQLSAPNDLVIDPSGRLIVSSSSTARLEMFGLDAYSDPEKFIPAEVEVAPDPFRPGSDPKVTVVLEVPGYRLGLIEVASLAANGVPTLPGSVVFGDADGDSEPDLSAAFDGPAIAATLVSEGEDVVRVAARLGDLEAEAFGRIRVVAGPSGDGDGDGIVDSADACPETAAGSPVDDGGCSVEQLCPCFGSGPDQPWKNHGQYVACVTGAVRRISRPPLDEPARSRRIREAAQSDCGKRRLEVVALP